MAKTKKQYVEYNCATGETIKRDYTAEELAQFEIETQLNAEQEAIEAAKETQRQVILDRLGLTSDEARLLLGS